MMAELPIRVRVTEVTVTCMPEGSPDEHILSLKVVERSPDRYAVLHAGFALGSDGNWDYEGHPSERREEWLATHRFDYNTALRLAAEWAPKIRVNGQTAGDVVGWYEFQAGKEA
jgi:hypothetical protein